MTDLPAVPGEEARSSVLESGPLTHTRVGLGVGVGGGGDCEGYLGQVKPGVTRHHHHHSVHA